MTYHVRYIYMYIYNKAGMLLLKIGRRFLYREINVIINLGMYLFISVNINASNAVPYLSVPAPRCLSI